jgi:acyl carrier protein
MSRDEIEGSVREVFELFLNRPIAPGQDVNPETELDWDSVRHVELIFMLEEALSLTFAAEEIEHLRSIRAIVDRVVARSADEL